MKEEQGNLANKFGDFFFFGLPFITIILFLVLCWSGSESAKAENKGEESQKSVAIESIADSEINGTKEVTLPDPRWPTTDSYLLSIPESERWYNACQQIGHVCTIVGPVVSVTRAANSKGQPVFINIGSEYPAQDCVTILIWEEDMDDPDWEALAVNVRNRPNSWVSINGLLLSYEGRAQFKSDQLVYGFRYWTDVP